MKKIVFGLFIAIANICVASDFGWSSFPKQVSSEVQYNDPSRSFLDPARNYPGPALGNNGPFFGVSVSHDNMGLRLAGLAGQTAFSLKFRDLQKNGDMAGIQAHIHQMKNARVLCRRLQKIELVSSIFNEPITQIMHDIKYGTLEQAQAAIRRLFTLSPYKYRYGSDGHPAIFEYKKAYYKQKYSYDVLEEAKALYEGRGNVPPVPGCPEHIGFYSSPDHPSVSAVQHQSLLGKTASSSDYKKLYDQVAQQCASLQDKIGYIPDYYQSREQAIKQIMLGNDTVHKQTYDLSPQARAILKQHGLKPKQFITCSGNSLQHDTNAKLVQSLNALAQKSVTSQATQQIKIGVLECAHIGNQLNRNGKLHEATQMADMCHVAVEYLWHSLDTTLAISKGLANGTYIGVSTQLAHIFSDGSTPQATLQAGHSEQSGLSSQVATETATIVAELLRFVKDTGEVAASGVAGVGDAAVGLRELATQCVECVQLTGNCLGYLGKETIVLLDAAQRKDIPAFERQSNKMQTECSQVVQGLGEFLTQIKAQKSCINGQITKSDVESWARSGARMATEGIIVAHTLRGCSKIMKGVKTHLESMQAACAQVQGMKHASVAQMREALLVAQLEGLMPLHNSASSSGACDIVERVVLRTAAAPEVVTNSVEHVAKENITSAIVQQEATASTIAQRVGQLLSLEPKPGFIALSGTKQSQSRDNTIEAKQHINEIEAKRESIRQIIMNRERKITIEEAHALGFRGEIVEDVNSYNRITGEIKLHTESMGGAEKGQKVFYELVNEKLETAKSSPKEIRELKNGIERVFYEFDDGSTIQSRSCGKSGHFKIEILDTINNIKEKITFK